jgi:hypothetical protein
MIVLKKNNWLINQLIFFSKFPLAANTINGAMNKNINRTIRAIIIISVCYNKTFMLNVLTLPDKKNDGGQRSDNCNAKTGRGLPLPT